MSSYSKVRAVDGTILRAWTNDGTGVPVVISNGLGASPTAWPAIVAPDSGFRVVTWHHRGLGGSERPARAGAIRVEDFASDLGAVMASAGMEHALIVGWSFGVNAAFEFARLRTRSNLRSACGRRGAWWQPRCDVWAHENAKTPSRASRADQCPTPSRHRAVADDSRRSHAAAQYPARPSEADAIVQEAMHVPALRVMLREFAAHDWEWYSRLAVALGEHAPMNVADTSFPVTFLGGRHDAITASEDIQAVANTIPRSSSTYSARCLTLAAAAVSGAHAQGTAQARAKKRPRLTSPLGLALSTDRSTVALLERLRHSRLHASRGAIRVTSRLAPAADSAVAATEF